MRGQILDKIYERRQLSLAIYAQIVTGDRTRQGPVQSWINNISTVVRRTLAQSWLNLPLFHVRTQRGGRGGGNSEWVC